MTVTPYQLRLCPEDARRDLRNPYDRGHAVVLALRTSGSGCPQWKAAVVVGKPEP